MSLETDMIMCPNEKCLFVGIWEDYIHVTHDLRCPKCERLFYDGLDGESKKVTLKGEKEHLEYLKEHKLDEIKEIDEEIVLQKKKIAKVESYIGTFVN